MIGLGAQNVTLVDVVELRFKIGMIKLYRVVNGEGLNPDGERKKANESFSPHFIHVRNNETGGYIVVVIAQEIHEDFILMDASDPEYDEIYEWASQEGFIDEMFDPEITGTIN